MPMSAGVECGSIRADLRNVGHPPDASPTLPPRCYTDDDWLARERDLIFNRAWIALGREDRWRRSGEYAAVDLPGAPLAVMRDGDRRLRAWANTCRHRGMKLLSGEGRRKTVVCPLHARTYGLDGRLIAAPRMETCAGFKRGDFNLIEFRLECSDGFAFVCLLSCQTPYFQRVSSLVRSVSGRDGLAGLIGALTFEHAEHLSGEFDHGRAGGLTSGGRILAPAKRIPAPLPLTPPAGIFPPTSTIAPPPRIPS